MKKLLCIITLISLILTMSGCSLIQKTVINSNRLFGIAEEKYTSFEGVSISIENIDTSKDYPVFTVKWTNDSDEEITFGMGYYIERLDGDEWKSVQTSDFAIIEIACIMKPGESGNQTYSGEYFSFKKFGMYRIRTDFYAQGENFGGHTTWATFEVIPK